MAPVFLCVRQRGLSGNRDICLWKFAKVKDEKGNFQCHHGDPAPEGCPGKTSKPAAPDPDKEISGEEAEGHVGNGTDESDFQVSHAPEKSLDNVGGCRHDVHNGDQL